MKIEKTIAVPFAVQKPLRFFEEDEPMTEWVNMGEYYESRLIDRAEFVCVTYHKIDVECFDDELRKRR